MAIPEQTAVTPKANAQKAPPPTPTPVRGDEKKINKIANKAAEKSSKTEQRYDASRPVISK